MPALVVLSSPWVDSSFPYAHSKAATTTAVKSNKGVALDNRDPIESNIVLHHIVGIVSDLMEDSSAGHRLNEAHIAIAGFEVSRCHREILKRNHLCLLNLLCQMRIDGHYRHHRLLIWADTCTSLIYLL